MLAARTFPGLGVLWSRTVELRGGVEERLWAGLRAAYLALAAQHKLTESLCQVLESRGSQQAATQPVLDIPGDGELSPLNKAFS